MQRLAKLITYFFLSSSLCLAQSSGSTPQASGSNAQATSAATTRQAGSNQSGEIRGTFPTALVKGLDSKKLKDGDAVVCQTTAVLHSRSGLMVPTGAKVYGHVTQATARSKGDPTATLAMAFDKIEVSKGKEIPLKGVLQAVGPGLGQDTGPNTGVAGGNVLAGRGDATPATTAPPMASSQVPSPRSVPILNAQSQGVLGIRNLQMDKDSVLSSTGKEVKLDNGTQMLIRAEIQVPVE